MTDWKKELEDNRDAIEVKMVELYREWEGTNQDVHEGLAIEPSGKLYTWTYAGNYSEPEAIWKGTDFCITVFNAWDWEDSNNDWKELASLYAEDEEKEKVMSRIAEEKQEGYWGKSILELLHDEFPKVYADIAEGEIDAEMEHYRETVSYLLDDIIANVEYRINYYIRQWQLDKTISSVQEI